MQTARASRGILGLVLVLSGCSFKPRDSFSAALKKFEGTAVEQVHQAGIGAPYFSARVLNPVWNVSETEKIVRIPDLKLTDQNGHSVDQQFFKDKVTFITFIFTTCNGFCPNLIQQLKAIAKELEGQKGVQYVAITVDPEHDQPEQLRAFAAKMHLPADGSWTLLTGQRETIYSLIKDTFASQAFQKLKPGPRNFAHSEHFYVIDGEGRLRGILNGTRLDSQQAAPKLLAQIRN